MDKLPNAAPYGKWSPGAVEALIRQRTRIADAAERRAVGATSTAPRAQDAAPSSGRTRAGTAAAVALAGGGAPPCGHPGSVRPRRCAPSDRAATDGAASR